MGERAAVCVFAGRSESLTRAGPAEGPPAIPSSTREYPMQKLQLDLDEIEVTSFEAEKPLLVPEGGVLANTTVDACIPTIVRPKTCDC